MKKLLMAAVAVMTAGSAHAQSGLGIIVSPNISVLTQLNVAVPVNVSPSTAVAVSVYGNAAAKATTINFQQVFGTNQGWFNNSFISGH